MENYHLCELEKLQDLLHWVARVILSLDHLLVDVAARRVSHKVFRGIVDRRLLF
jgi:hypothetical protein